MASVKAIITSKTPQIGGNEAVFSVKAAMTGNRDEIKKTTATKMASEQAHEGMGFGAT
jgi:hypothetical protein